MSWAAYAYGIAQDHAVQLEAEAENQRLREELDGLRAGIEKLRDSCDDEWSRKVGLSAQWVARRLTELLEHGDET